MHERKNGVRQPHYLREWREASGLSLADMAARTTFGKSTLSRVETGKIAYYADILEAYAGVFGCKPYALLMRPPGGPEDLFAIIEQLLAEHRANDLQRVAGMTKLLLAEV